MGFDNLKPCQVVARTSCGGRDASACHDGDALGLALVDVLGDGFQAAAREFERRAVEPPHPGFFIAHLASARTGFGALVVAVAASTTYRGDGATALGGRSGEVMQ
jgi:hypothetical protein